MLGWATIGMGLFYLAYRYNILFVTDTQIDTHGLIYPRALKQLFTGIYLAEICMLGLFITSVAIGPIILMVVFLVFTVLFQVSIGKALDPLLYQMPRSLLVEAEQQGLLAHAAMAPGSGSDLEAAAATTSAATATNNGHHSPISSEKKVVSKMSDAVVEPKRGNFVIRFLQPWIYADYHTLSKLVPQHEVGPADDEDMYPGETGQNAYFPPSVASPTPLLWIPEDLAKVSKEEVAHTAKVIAITDEGCTLDEKGNIVWDAEGARPPVWEEKINY